MRPRARSAGRAASFWPKEHGAYGQLFVPMAAAIASGGGAPAAWLWALAATLAFFASEPMRVALGERGARAMRGRGREAVTRAFVLAAGSAACALAALSYGRVPWPVLFAVAALAAASTTLAATRRVKTLAGESLAALTLSGAGVPVALGGGVPLAVALVAWLSWGVAFLVAVASVHWIVARHKRRSHHAARALVLLAAAILAVSMRGAGFAVLSTLPTWLVSMVVVALAPPPTALRRVGWSLAASTVAVAVALVVVARLA